MFKSNLITIVIFKTVSDSFDDSTVMNSDYFSLTAKGGH